ncbi:MAG: 2-C-methyl-D-erythritol 4-phosphate cytidylyltransferase [Bdellovibrionales bacterium]|nr:2-C-methyl-D-erythritol 4-phosphate cytidylyltransferase [Bdellovibrionales bacterium]
MLISDAVLLGGGVGKRYSDSCNGKSSVPKQFELLKGIPVFVHALKALESTGLFRTFVLVFPQAFLEEARTAVNEYASPALRTRCIFVSGGEQRQDSSRLGVRALATQDPLPTRVVIHDACRPYLSPEFMERMEAALVDRSYGAWIPTVPVVETIKSVRSKQVVETIDRSSLHRVQTPQIFEYGVLRSLFENLENDCSLHFTDDASICEYYGIPVGVFGGDERNIKLTYSFEMEMLRILFQGQTQSSLEAGCDSESATTFTA